MPRVLDGYFDALEFPFNREASALPGFVKVCPSQVGENERLSKPYGNSASYSAHSRSHTGRAEAKRSRKSKVSVNDSITVTITTAMLLSIINLTDTKSLEEAQDNFWKSLSAGSSELAGAH